MLHHFHGGAHQPTQGSIDAETFRAMLELIGRDRLLSAEEWLSRAEAGALGPEHVCVTFDDALLCQYEIALPVLEALGLTAFWFVYTSVLRGEAEQLEIFRHFRTLCFEGVEAFYAAFFAEAEAMIPTTYRAEAKRFDPKKYLVHSRFYTDDDRWFRYLRDRVLDDGRYRELMHGMMRARSYDAEQAARELWVTSENVRRLSEGGHVVGLHSDTHPTVMAALPPERQKQEYARNQAELADLIGAPPRTMSHPCNSYNADTLAILSELGVTTGFRADLAPVSGRSALERPRIDHADLVPLVVGRATA